MARRPKAAAYIGMLALETTAATCLACMILPLFGRMIAQLGTPPELEPWRLVAIIGGVIVLQLSYWMRLIYVPIYVPFHNKMIGHLLLFGSRVSFFIGGAFFSVVFFRHVPELDALPPFGQAAAKAVVIIATLFSLFCYSLELERLGKAIEELPSVPPDA